MLGELFLCQSRT